MPTTVKTVIGQALAVKNEATYNAGISMSLGSDAVEVATLPLFDIAYAFDGARPFPPGTAGNARRVVPNGRTTKGTISILGKGLGNGAYTTATLPPNIHCLMLSAGYSSSVNAGTYVYSPTPVGTAPSSFAAEIFSRGEKYPVSGGYSTLTINAANGGPCTFDFDVEATVALPADVTLPSAQYSGTLVVPPDAAPLSLTASFGSAYTTARVRSVKYEDKRAWSPRVDINAAAGHAGFTPGRRDPTLTVVMEAEALSTFNAYSLRDLATTGSVTFGIGTVVGNSIDVTLNQSNISEVKQAADGDTATWEVTIKPYPSTPTANDDVQIVLG